MPESIALELQKTMNFEQQLAQLRPYFYFRAKAQIYLRKGAEEFRRDDFFHCPRVEWTDQDLADLECGYRQIMNWRGLIPQVPLEDLGLDELYRMMEVAHFQLDRLSVEPSAGNAFTGTANLKHRVDG